MKEFLSLSKYALPYRKLLFLAFLFIMLSTAMELALPYIVKHAIDTYVTPQVALLERKPEWYADFEEAFLDRYVILSKLPMEKRIQLEKEGLLSDERFFVVSDSVEGATNIGGMYVLSVDDYEKLDTQTMIRIRREDVRGILLAGSLYILLLVMNFLMNFGQIFMLSLLGQKSIYDMRIGLFRHLLELRMDFFQKNQVGRIVTRLTNDINAINEFYASVLVSLLKDILLILGIMMVMFFISPQLSMFIIVLLPGVIVLTLIFRYFARKIYDRIRVLLARINAFINETLNGLIVVRAFGREDYMKSIFNRMNEEIYNVYIRLIFVFGTFRPLISFFSILALALIVWKGGEGILKQYFTFGSFVAFLSYIEMLFSPIGDLADKYNIMQSAFIASKRVFLIMKEPKEPTGDFKSERIQGSITFEDVWFSYDGRKYVLKGVSFNIQPKQKVAIVGPTGSGKTTIMNLLLRFWDVDRGRILLDGVDVRKYDLSFLRQNVSIALQDTYILTDDEELSRMEPYLRAFNMEHLLYKDTSKLSSGEKQLLSLARALSRNSPIVLLDEPTSNMDQATENVVQAFLRSYLKDRTAIVIAHRFSTIRYVDRIIVLYYGKLVEQGTHEELMSNRGIYYNLYKLHTALSS